MDQGGIRCEGIEKVGECPDGKVPTLAPENFEIWNLFQLMMPGLIRQDGYDYTAIQVVFDVHGIEQARRPGLMVQITKLIDVIETERRKRTKT